MKSSVMQRIYFFLILVVFSFTGCVKNGHYRLMRLVPPVVTEEQVFVQGKVLKTEEVQGLLGGTGNMKKMTAVQLYLKNPTSSAYIFTPRNMNTKSVPLRLVARSFHKNILARVIPLGLISCVCWPFSVPTTILGMRALHHNEMIDRQLDEIAIDPFDSFIIEAHSTLNRVLFIKNKYLPEKLSLELEQINSSVVKKFSVDLLDDPMKVV